jgi:hypothetical protein
MTTALIFIVELSGLSLFKGLAVYHTEHEGKNLIVVVCQL